MFLSKLNIIALVFLSSGIFFSCKEKEPEKVVHQTSSKGFQPTLTNSRAPVWRSAIRDFGFVEAAKIVTPGVVHIKTSYSVDERNIFERLGQNIPLKGSGSGVTISPDGYIATNNHVIVDASSIEVVFPDKRHFTAKLIGSDPNTDLALLKVDATDLPYVPFGNSDEAQIGEWVLAVGYPYSLNTTVTAGIISAKGRSIGIIASSNTSRDVRGYANSAVESFIQTDAAINAGNSGGALVNTNGELIGINTAIASITGSYAGYAFAVPINLAKKVLEDLKDFGTVKRGMLGISFPAPIVEDEYLKQMGVNPGSVKGVYITSIQRNSAADEAGLKQGDIIQYVDSFEIPSSAEFSERIARLRPGDKVKIGYLRKGKLNTTVATLKGEETKESIAGESESLKDIQNKLGAKFSNIPREIKKLYDVKEGVLVTEVMPGGFFDDVGIPEGTIIVSINGHVVSDPQDVTKVLSKMRSSQLQILGITPDGSRVAFNISLGT